MQRNRSHVVPVSLAGLLVLLAICAHNSPHAPPTPCEPAIPTPDAKPHQLLFFTQAGCPPCKVVEASLQDPAVKALLASSFELSEVRPPDPRYEQYGVTGTPTLIAFVGNAKHTRVGALSAADLLAWLQSLDKPDNKRPRKPVLPRRESRPRRPGTSSEIVEGGPYDGPDGREVMIDYPPEMWKENITSRGQGCCVFRSIDFAAHWQNVPALWGFPEWLRSKGEPGGGYAGNVDDRIAAICRERGVAAPEYVNVESSRDYALLKMVIDTGRLPVVTYNGRDGVHYSDSIAHMVTVAYADDDFVAVLDNNFPPDKLLWMPASEFKTRWTGWIVALLAPRPPAPPHN